MEWKEILAHVDHTLLKPQARWEEIRQIVEEGIAYGCASVCIPPSYVQQAAEYAAGDSRPFSAMERRVRRWHESGVRSVAAAQAGHAQENAASGEKAATPPVSRALRPPQRTYTAEDLKHIGVNLLDDEDE